VLLIDPKGSYIIYLLDATEDTMRRLTPERNDTKDPSKIPAPRTLSTPNYPSPRHNIMDIMQYKTRLVNPLTDPTVASHLKSP